MTGPDPRPGGREPDPRPGGRERGIPLWYRTCAIRGHTGDRHQHRRWPAVGRRRAEVEERVEDAESGGRETEVDSSPSSRSLLDRVRGGWRGVAVRVAVVALLVLGLGWAAAYTGLGMGAVVRWALERVAPEGWAPEVGSVEGSWLGRVELSELTLEGPDGSLSVERLLLRYRLTPLLDKTVEVGGARGRAPALRAADPGFGRGRHPARRHRSRRHGRRHPGARCLPVSP